MSDRDMIILIDEEYNNDAEGTQVLGKGIVIDGKLKNILDKIISERYDYNDYDEVLKDAICLGLLEIINTNY